ncbi:DDE superfamily endonuclease [Wolbachia endosymbiont of Cylisticus convexus]|nr:DDE superfamily endonuclease [Wolbachia endosymbiont of Cylisticus convexus]
MGIVTAKYLKHTSKIGLSQYKNLIILDNASFHKSERTKKLKESVECKVLFLPGMFKKVCQAAFLVQLNFQPIWKENIKLRHS